MVKFKKLFLLILTISLIYAIPKDTFALDIYAYRGNDETWIVGPGQPYWHNVNSNFNNWGWNLGSGYIRFNFTLEKYAGDSTSAVITPRVVNVVNTHGNEFPCDVGSVSANNSTSNVQTYSAMCPVNFYNDSGLTRINFNFEIPDVQSVGYYYVYFDGRLSFEVPQFIQDNSQSIINSQTQILQEQQQTTQAIEDNTDAINDLKDTINDDDVDADSKLDDLFSGKIDYTSTPIIGIFRMPITFLQKILNSVNGTCSSFNLGRFEFANYSFVLPCITPSRYLRSNNFDLWTIITGLFNMFMIYNIGVLMFRFYECVTDLKSPLYLLFGRSFDTDDKRNS